jgi:hypothetical protein
MEGMIVVKVLMSSSRRSLYLFINKCIGIYIVLYKHIVEVNKYMNINYFYRALHFNIYEITLTRIIKTYLALCIIL